MQQFNFDFDLEINADAYKNEIKIIEKGRYNFIIDKVELGFTKNGNKQIKINFKITSDKFKNYYVFERFVFASKEQSDFNLNKISGIVKACSFKSLKSNELENLVGKELSAYVYHKFNDHFGTNEPQLRQFEVKDFVQSNIIDDNKNIYNIRNPAPEPTTVNRNTPRPISKSVAAKKDDTDDDLPF